MARVGFVAGLICAAVLNGAEAAHAQSRTPSQEQDAIAGELLSRMERYCLSAADAEESLARARTEGFVWLPALLAAVVTQQGGADGRALWKVADGELWFLVVGALRRPDGVGEICAVAAHPSVDDMSARLDAALSVGAAQTLSPGMNGFVFEQRPDGTRQGMAVGQATKQLRGPKARSLRLVAIQDAPIMPGTRMTAIIVTRPR